MNSEEQRLINMLQDVFATQENEIQCEAASTQMIQSAQAQLSDEVSQQRFPQLWQHFRVCSDCQREYRMMQDMIHLEETGQLEYPQSVPPVPTRNQSPRWSLKDVISRIFPGFSPTLAPDPTRSNAVTSGEELNFEPVEISLDDQLSLEFSVDVSSTDSQLRNLYGIVDKDGETFEGSPVWLHEGNDGPVVQETALDMFGDFSLMSITPGQYALRLKIERKTYVVLNIALP